MPVPSTQQPPVAPRSAAGQTADELRFRSFPLAVFRMNCLTNVDLYAQGPGQERPVLYRSPRVPISAADIDELIERGHRMLYVCEGDATSCEAALQASLAGQLQNTSISPQDRFAILQGAAACEINAAFRMVKSDRYVDLSQQISGQITALLAEGDFTPRQLFQIVQHDFCTFTHMTNVAGFAALLAEELGFCGAGEQEKIVLGALLHDIGKRFVPAEVLNCPTKLSDAQWRCVRQHPQRGYEELCDRHDIELRQLLMVYSHHERIDGRGYPVGLVDEEIDPWAKMLAVVDVFDALTSARPYRMPIPCSRALEFLEKGAGTQFDTEMVRCWKLLMEKT
jgi:HD-GYP domain-containing protein (c-di-GMP phosphodiesterase class II)